MIDTISDWEIGHPERTYWSLNIPSSSDNAQTWKTFVTMILGKPPQDARTDAMAKQTVEEWCAEYNMLESDSSMLEERLSWKICACNELIHLLWAWWEKPFQVALHMIAFARR